VYCISPDTHRDRSYHCSFSHVLLFYFTPYTNCVQVSTEIITPNLYHGNDRAFLLQNTLFRCGGAAMILSNRWTDAFKARFKLLHVVRTQVRVLCCGVC
jgi:hypothetical protein